MEHKFKKNYKELSEKIESGEYFLEAREWYLKKYLYNFVERAYLLVIILVLFGLLALSGYYYLSILPITKSLPIQVNIKSAAEQSARIVYLGNKEKDFDINEVFVKYFIVRFVEAIESYDYKDDFKKLRRNRNIIEKLGSEDILAYYLDRISIRNRDSIIVKYKKDVVRTIIPNEKSVVLKRIDDAEAISVFEKGINRSDVSDEIRRYQVTLNCDLNEIDRSGNVIKSKWESNIILSFQAITYNFKDKDFSPLNMKVLKYESKKIE